MIKPIKVLINGLSFEFWETLEFTFSSDSISTFSFKSSFDPLNEFLKSTFVPLSYPKIQITRDSQPVFTGYVVDISPLSTVTENSISVSGYGLPAVLNDCTAPIESYPLSFSLMSLTQIAQLVTPLFEIVPVFTEPSVELFNKTTLSAGEKVLSYLIKLAKQRGFFIKDNELGNLVFNKPSITSPVSQTFAEVEGTRAITSISPSFDPQNFYSSITGLSSGKKGKPLESFTVLNPFLQTVKRPYTYTVQDVFGADLIKAVSHKAALMFGNVVTYDIKGNGWDNALGVQWEPDKLVTLKSPKNMIYSDFLLYVKKVNLSVDAENERFSLNCVLPESMVGLMPTTLPWLS